MKMNMDDGSSGMEMSMSMDMVMTFQSWSEYQVKILFDGWDVTEKWQFALSWFAIVFSAVGYHALRYSIESMETYREIALNKEIKGGNITENLVHKHDKGAGTPLTGDIGHSSLMSSVKYYAVHASLIALSYGISLMLMLVAMTYNPWLFIALMVGWGIGDFVFYKRTVVLRRMNNLAGSEDMTSCH